MEEGPDRPFVPFISYPLVTVVTVPSIVLMDEGGRTMALETGLAPIDTFIATRELADLA
jgi:hypothetical protein